jgi:cyanophycinase-like exopeptidase
MPHVNIFKWLAGRGWLVLAGGGPWETPDALNIQASLLSHTHSQGPLAYVWAASDVDTADRHMEALRELGARTGYLVDIMTETDDELFRQISEAGVIILGDGPRSEDLHDALIGVALRGIQEAFNRGATIYAVGSSAAMLGSFYLHDDEALAGFGWLSGAIVLPGYTSEQADLMRAQVAARPESYGLGLGEGAALALGPRGEVEVWGNEAITVALGQAYSPDSSGAGEE